MMCEWKVTTLKDVSTDGGHYGIAASAVDFSVDLPTYLRITDIRDDGSIDFSGLMSVADADAKDYYLAPNDLVIARTGASTGRNYFYDGRDGKFVYAGFLIKFSISPNKIYPLFVKYWFQSPAYKSWLISHTDGSTRANINAVTLGECPICFPSDISTQKKIAAVLSALDDKIENNRRICKTLEEMAQAIFRSWFVDFEPWGGVMPEGWRRGKLGDLVMISRNSVTPGDMPETVEHYSLPAFDETHLPSYDMSSTIKSNKFRVGKNAILYSKLNPSIKRLWDPFVDTETAVSSTEFVVIEPRLVVQRYFIYSILDARSFHEYACSHSAGTTNSHQRISPEDILGFDLWIPNDEIIKKYSELVEPMFTTVKVALKEISKLALMRDALLPKLMSGEIDVEGVAV